MDKKEKMFALVVQYKSSGYSMKTFSAEHNIKLSTFAYWVQKKRRADEAQSTAPFLPINKPIDSNGLEKVEIIYSNGTKVRLSYFDVNKIRQLITLYGC